MKIPIAKPYFGIEEQQAILEPLKTGWVVQGPKVQEFEKMVARVTGVEHAIAVSSCTTGLHLALVGLGIGIGDEVIVPSFTYVATANAVEHAGATPVFCDIDLATFNIDVKQIESKITEKTKAIIPVHLFGLSADMNPIMKLAGEYGLKIIEDAACALATQYEGQAVGGIGDVGCFSFHPRKIVTTGEGGMLTTNDGNLAERLRALRTHGATISDLARHKKSGSLLPEFNLLGYNYRMTDMQGAIGVEQMKKLDWMIENRIRLSRRYDEMLRDVEWLKLPYVPPNSKHTYQSYVTLVVEDSPLSRNDIMQKLEDAGISTRQGTHAVHTLGYYKQKYGFQESDFPSSLKADRQSMALPLYPQMTDEEQDYVINNITDIFSLY